MINSKATRIEKFYNLPIIGFSNHYLGLLSFLLTEGGSLGGQIHVRVRSTSEPFNLKPNLDHNTDLVCSVYSVPARLGNGQGAKEIRHNLARERPKFGHNLVSKRHKIGQSLECE